MKTLRFFRLAALAAAWLGGQPAAGAPFVPRDDAMVLEVLPGKRDDATAAELRRLRAAVAAAPTDAAAAVRLARRYFELAMEQGDPRYVGYAEAVVRPWPEGAGAPAEMLVMRGKLRHSTATISRARWRTSISRCRRIRRTSARAPGAPPF